jgi:hypothetical protein
MPIGERYLFTIRGRLFQAAYRNFHRHRRKKIRGQATLLFMSVAVLLETTMQLPSNLLCELTTILCYKE